MPRPFSGSAQAHPFTEPTSTSIMSIRAVKALVRLWTELSMVAYAISIICTGP